MTSVRHLPAEDRRALTIQTVIELASRKNPAAITTTDIARHMGLTQGALFRHFPTKDELWLAVMDWVAEHLMKRLDQAAQGLDSPLAALQAMFLAHAGFVLEHPGVPRMIFGELQHAETSDAKNRVLRLIRGYGERLQKLIERGKACGELPDSLDVDAAATLFIGTLQGLVMQSLLAGDVQRIGRDAPKVFAIYLRGIRSAA